MVRCTALAGWKCLVSHSTRRATQGHAVRPILLAGNLLCHPHRAWAWSLILAAEHDLVPRRDRRAALLLSGRRLCGGLAVADRGAWSRVGDGVGGVVRRFVEGLGDWVEHGLGTGTGVHPVSY